MENVEIADALERVADLLEIQEANPFRVRAYRNAARTVEGHAVPLEKMLEREEDLTQLPGIGKEMASHIRELVETGELSTFLELSKEIPPSLIGLMRLPGVGPKKARKLWKELGVETVEALEEEARAERVKELEGFGEKTQAKILEGIESYRRHTSRFRLSEVDELVQPLLEHMRGLEEARRCEVAGSWRRRRETVGDVDLLVLASEPEPVMERFTSFSRVTKVLASGGTKGSVELRNGLQVDLRIVPEESYGAALVYFTGSKQHNIKLRQRALDRGLRVSEYGVFRIPEEAGGDDGSAGDADGDDGSAGDADGDDGSAGGEDRSAADEGGSAGDTDGSAADADADGPAADADGEAGNGSAAAGRGPVTGEWVAGRDEEEVYAALDLPWIPPELREDRGEIDAAEAGELPELVTVEDLRGDLQMHSTWSDGKNSIEEMLEACAERGYEYLAITDHSQALAMTGGLDEAKLRQQWEELEEVQARHPEIRILRSLEVDILRDGSLDLSDEMLEALDLVVVSVHSFFNLPVEEQTERVLRALEHPEVNVLAHPTGRIINRRDPIQLEVDEVLEAAAEHGVAVELNAQPDRLDLRDIHLLRARELGVKVVISTDAHRTAELEFIQYGVEQARRAWLEARHVLNALPLDDLLEAIRRAGPAGSAG